MPTYDIPGFSAQIRRDAMLVDTNVLVAKFLPDIDEWHEVANETLELVDQVLITEAVLVETWGMIAGSFKSIRQAETFLDWVATRGGIVMLQLRESIVGRSHALTKAYRVDLVDSMLGVCADELTSKLDLVPPMTIVSLDARDFATIRYKAGIKMRLYDLRSNDHY